MLWYSNLLQLIVPGRMNEDEEEGVVHTPRSTHPLPLIGRGRLYGRQHHIDNIHSLIDKVCCWIRVLCKYGCGELYVLVSLLQSDPHNSHNSHNFLNPIYTITILLCSHCVARATKRV